MFHQRLSALLAEKEIKQADFARLMGKSPQAVNGWVKGTSEPDLGTITEIARKLEVSILRLIPDPVELKEKTADQIAAKLRARGIIPLGASRNLRDAAMNGVLALCWRFGVVHGSLFRDEG